MTGSPLIEIEFPLSLPSYSFMGMSFSLDKTDSKMDSSLAESLIVRLYPCFRY